jgi:hypothetical protein
VETVGRLDRKERNLGSWITGSVQKQKAFVREYVASILELFATQEKEISRQYRPE